MNIGVIGLGYVGLTFSVIAARSGSVVYGVENNLQIIDCLKAGKAHFYEPGINDLIQLYTNRSFFVGEAFPHNVKFDAFVITVGTPLKEDTQEPNFEYIKQALDVIAPCYHGDELVVLRSTVSAGTTRQIVIPYLENLCDESKNKIQVSFCPERTVEGKALEELVNLPQIISGNNSKAIENAGLIFENIAPEIIICDSLEEAELIKLFNNTYRDMHFAIGNILCVAAQKLGVDGKKVINVANKGYPRSNIALPGLVGGPCITKDAYLLTYPLEDSDEKRLIQGIRNFNLKMEDKIIDWVVSKMPNTKTGTICLSGMAFKGTPDTSDLRGSSSVNIAYKLEKIGYKLKLHDFICPVSELEKLHIGQVNNDFIQAVSGTSLVLILNNNQRYGSIIPWKIPDNKKVYVLDIWDKCEHLQGSQQICVRTIGNLLIQ